MIEIDGGLCLQAAFGTDDDLGRDTANSARDRGDRHRVQMVNDLLPGQDQYRAPAVRLGEAKQPDFATTYLGHC